MVESGGADELHLDSMDGVFVPNFTWGMKIVADLRKLTRLPFDCHLMIVEPEKYVDAFREAGADMITFHYEATPHQHRLLRHIRKDLGAKAGIAINPGTPVAMLVDLVEEIDRVLVMSVNPGFGGQSFIERALTKIIEVRAMLEQVQPALLDRGRRRDRSRQHRARGARRRRRAGRRQLRVRQRRSARSPARDAAPDRRRAGAGRMICAQACAV